MNEPRDDESNRSSAGEGKSMGFWEHLNELRTTLIKSVAAFAICAGLIGYYLNEFQLLVMWPFEQAASQYPHLDITLGTNGPTEGINMILESCVFGGLTLAAPFILFFVAQFVTPALTQKEAKVVVPMCLSACLLFLGGAAFAYLFLMPAAMKVFIEVDMKLHAAIRWSMGSYYTIFTRTVFGVGAAFEFPLLIMVLVWLGIVSTATLRKYRRHAIVVIFIIAALITVSTEPISQLLCAAPLYVLYEIAIILSRRIEKRRERSGAAALVALLALCRVNQHTAELRAASQAAAGC
ncbi:MAG: twin-arginine translocase subunit TatC [Opitutaceae bacterium]